MIMGALEYVHPQLTCCLAALQTDVNMLAYVDTLEQWNSI